MQGNSINGELTVNIIYIIQLGMYGDLITFEQ